MEFTRCAWSEEAAQGLGDTMGEFTDDFRHQIRQGIAQLWRIEKHSWMITRTETFTHQAPELVVCCYKGKHLKKVTEAIVKTAKNNGFGSIRFHTQRQGMQRLINNNFQYYETVYRKIL